MSRSLPTANSVDDLPRRLRAIQLLIFDVDGVLTDGRLVLSSSGEESKRFHIRDGLGIVLAQRAGLAIGLVSGRRSPAVDRRAVELGIPADLYLAGTREKGRAVRALRERLGVTAEAVAFVGDDLNDLPAFEEAGVAVAVGDAASDVKARADLVTACGGGEGAAREVIERILREQGRWEDAVRAYMDLLRREAEDGESVQ